MEATLMSLGSGWVSGIRPYFMIFLLGLAGRVFGLEQVPTVLQRTDVLVVAAVLLLVDLAADKIAYFDSFWDQLNTVVRPLAGAVLGYLLAGETDVVNAIVMALLGGGAALGAHAAKSTARAAVNVSPEPVSNVVVSTGEDLLALVMGLLTITVPLVAGALALVLLLIGGYIAYRILRSMRRLRERLREARRRRAPVPAGEV
ncbi:DUF4126 domain-containing protein [Brachybacterium sp. EF45031]|uniref:DUF4126 domain-containing protein n=1 Tax=Brachybacterium sillae TaxID=2810536 RepID=UPI00217F00BF|nr:DUF4126 domain-containing protein [Brachybacterium sillae]MCS6711454.1 DUF4126 domain-containing protein [Brachybacterium sillae]